MGAERVASVTSKAVSVSIRPVGRTSASLVISRVTCFGCMHTHLKHTHTPGLFCIHLTYMVRWWTACSRGLLLYKFWDLGVQGRQPFKAVCSIRTALAESQVQRLQRTQASTEAVHTHAHKADSLQSQARSWEIQVSHQETLCYSWACWVGQSPPCAQGFGGQTASWGCYFFLMRPTTVRDFRLPVSHVSVDAGRSCQVFIKIMLGLCFWHLDILQVITVLLMVAVF